MSRLVIIYGPQGCGKTRNAGALAKKYKLEHIVDGWAPGQDIPQRDSLILTNEPHVDLLQWRGSVDVRVIPFDQAMAGAA